VQLRELIGVLAQLCHMLTAGQSAEMPEKHEQSVLPTRQYIAERERLAFNCGKREIWRYISNGDHQGPLSTDPAAAGCSVVVAATRPLGFPITTG